ncbi:hypothetical protein [Geminicoccus harenae]|nr:hypothetical protein [Geminicoccus harenae]
MRDHAIDPDRTRIEFTVDATGLAAATGTMRVRQLRPIIRNRRSMPRR